LLDVAQIAWLTPAEIFSPHYGQAIAAYIVQKTRITRTADKPLCVLEIGGGTGTLASDILVSLQPVWYIAISRAVTGI